MAKEKETAAAIEVNKAAQEKAACVEQLEKLKGYRAEYVSEYKVKGQTGINAARLQEYQVFVQKIDKAIEEQMKVVEQAGDKIQQRQQHLKQTNSRKQVVEKLIDKQVKKEEHKEKRSEQNTADDRPRAGGSMNDVLMWRLV